MKTTLSKTTTKTWLVLLSLALLASGVATTHGQSALDGFDPNADGVVRVVVVQPDGKILLGGEFTTVLGVARSRRAPLNPDWTLDTVFNPNSDGYIYAIALQGDGKILVGGTFTSIGGQTRARIARLNPTTGSADFFNPNAGDSVNTI